MTDCCGDTVAKLGFSDFVDVVSRAGTGKLSKVTEVKHRKPYLPAIDYYKPIRDEICNAHKAGHTSTCLQQFLKTVHSKKQQNYSAIASGYSKWWGTQAFQWTQPPAGLIQHASVQLVVNPELGLSVTGQLHVIKLYFKGDPLSHQRADIATSVMEHGLRSHVPGAIFSILDVRKAKLFSSRGIITPTQVAMLTAELAYIDALWPNI